MEYTIARKENSCKKFPNKTNRMDQPMKSEDPKHKKIHKKLSKILRIFPFLWNFLNNFLQCPLVVNQYP